MGKLGFNGPTRRQLEQVLTHPKNARQLKRVQALLWVDEGEPVTLVAKRLRVTRQSVHNWINQVKQREGRTVDRLKDRPRSGRPRTKSDLVDEVLLDLLEKGPGEFGYHTPGWTNPLLREHFSSQYGLDISHQTLREAIRRAGYS